MPRRGFVHLTALTPSDTDDEEHVIEEIHCGGAGNIAVVLLDGTAVTLTGCLAGHRYPYRCRRINSTNTTATALVGASDGERVQDAISGAS